MNSRKRKIGTVVAPSEDELNASIKIHRPEATEEAQEVKVLNDPVHGHYELPKVLFSIIDTPQFQRLRDIKQLGTCYLIFPGACHNRFEHSTGVAFLAGQLCGNLQRKQPELGITDVDCLCVQIAGLCHDLGHGPFSHFFDGLFLPTVEPDSQWTHEKGSVAMFDHIVKENNLFPALRAAGLDENDVTFIKELILGPLHTKQNIENQWPYTGRPNSKSYLYELPCSYHVYPLPEQIHGFVDPISKIVSNKLTGIDVDKWDYFARDCYHLGISNNFDYKRYIKFARVVNVDGKLHICTRDKEAGTLYDMFHTRNSLHRRAYQHKTSTNIDAMLCDAFVKANDHLKFPGINGKMLRISDCIHDMFAYTHLTDSIIKLIEISQDKNLKEAQQLLLRIKKRDLYKLVGQTILPEKKSVEICADIIRHGENLHLDEFVVDIVEFDYGMKDENPIDHVRFYDKNKPEVAVKVSKNQVSQMLPEQFAEKHLRLYYKKKDPDILQAAVKAFNVWSEKMISKPAEICDLCAMHDCVSGFLTKS